VEEKSVNTALSIVAIVVVVALLIGAWWWVRSRRTPTSAGARGTLSDGWQFFIRPTRLEPPGTVFRIDRSKRRYIVDTLDIPTRSGEEAIGRTEESVKANMGMVARLFGLGPKLDVSAAHTETLTFELKGARREYLEDADLDSVLEPWLTALKPREGSHYYVIREVISGREITYRLNRDQVDKLGGEAALTDAAKLEGNLHASTSKSEYVLEQKFARPMRVMFLPEEVRPATRGLGEETMIGRDPVTQPLVWEETAEPTDAVEPETP
jgi:hypothetical protein